MGGLPNLQHERNMAWMSVNFSEPPKGAVMAWRSGQAYGQDLRDRVLSAHGSINAVA